MTWINRLRLLGGVLGVIVVVAALTLVFNLRQNSTPSTSAQVSANTIEIGGSYTGTVIKVYAESGDQVEKGDKLFTVQSPELRQDIANDLEVDNTDAWTVDQKAGTVTYLATGDGSLYGSRGIVGTALTSGTPFARIMVSDTKFVTAKYLLTPRDYGRLSPGASAQILLPNDQTIDGTVGGISVTTDEGRALASVRVNAEELSDPTISALTKIGTPVTATVTLRDDGPLAGVNDMTFDFLRKIGLK